MELDGSKPIVVQDNGEEGVDGEPKSTLYDGYKREGGPLAILDLAFIVETN